MLFFGLKKKYKFPNLTKINPFLSREIKLNNNFLLFSTQKKTTGGNKKKGGKNKNDKNKLPYDPNKTFFKETDSGIEVITEMDRSMTDEVDRQMSERIKPLKEKVDKEISDLNELRNQINEIENSKKPEKNKTKKEEKEKEKPNQSNKKEYSDVDNDFELFLYHSHRTNTTEGVMEKLLTGTYITYVKTDVQEDEEDELIKNSIDKNEIGIDSSVTRIMCEDYNEQGKKQNFFFNFHLI